MPAVAVVARGLAGVKRAGAVTDAVAACSLSARSQEGEALDMAGPVVAVGRVHAVLVEAG